MYKESSNRQNNPGDLISDEPQKAPCCTQDVRAQSVFFHGSSDCSGQLAQTPWPTTRGRGLLRPDWVSLAVKSFNDLAQFFAIKNFSAARHIRVYTKHVHMLQLLHELFHLLLAVRAEAACATASASSWASRSGSSNTHRAGATAAASRSSWANGSRSCSRRAGPKVEGAKEVGTYWGLGWGWGPGARGGAGAGGWGGGPRGGPGPGGRGWGTGAGAGGWDGDWGAKISPLHVTYVSIPSMSMCFSCFTNCSSCSWLYGPKPPAQLPVLSSYASRSGSSNTRPGRCRCCSSCANRRAGASAGGLLGAAGWGLGWG